MVEIKLKQQKSNFGLKAIGDLTLTVLTSGRAGAAARLESEHFNGYTLDAKNRLNNLSQRHHHLLVLAKQKKCEFAPEVESMLNGKNTEVQNNNNTQNYRKRVGQ